MIFCLLGVDPQRFIAASFPPLVTKVMLLSWQWTCQGKEDLFFFFFYLKPM